jgi:large conductance mechanosensitive channel
MSFLSDFKNFAFKGNVVDLAVGVVIGGAFGKIVTALVSDIVMPIVGLALPSGNWREAQYVLVPNADPKLVVGIKYGDFLGNLVDFLVIALVLFVVVSKIVAAAEARLATPAPAAAPTTKKCPFCLEQVPLEATRCKHCTSELPA